MTTENDEASRRPFAMLCEIAANPVKSLAAKVVPMIEAAVTIGEIYDAYNEHIAPLIDDLPVETLNGILDAMDARRAALETHAKTLSRSPITLDLNGRTVKGWFSVEHGGVWVTYIDSGGETRRNWTDVGGKAEAYEFAAKLTLQDLAKDDSDGVPSVTFLVMVPEWQRPAPDALLGRLKAIPGVLAVDAGANNIELEVQAKEADNVVKAVGAIGALRFETDIALMWRLVSPAPGRTLVRSK